MNLLLDTSILIEVERGNKKIIKILSELKEIHPAQPQLSFISYFEFLHGLRKRLPKNQEKSLAFIDLFEVLDATKRTASFLSLLKWKYELPLADLLIAAQVLEKQCILVTTDKDFGKIVEINNLIIEL